MKKSLMLFTALVLTLVSCDSKQGKEPSKEPKEKSTKNVGKVIPPKDSVWMFPTRQLVYSVDSLKIVYRNMTDTIILDSLGFLGQEDPQTISTTHSITQLGKVHVDLMTSYFEPLVVAHNDPKYQNLKYNMDLNSFYNLIDLDPSLSIEDIPVGEGVMFYLVAGTRNGDASYGYVMAKGKEIKQGNDYSYEVSPFSDDYRLVLSSNQYKSIPADSANARINKLRETFKFKLSATGTIDFFKKLEHPVHFFVPYREVRKFIDDNSSHVHFEVTHIQMVNAMRPPLSSFASSTITSQDGLRMYPIINAYNEHNDEEEDHYHAIIFMLGNDQQLLAIHQYNNQPGNYSNQAMDLAALCPPDCLAPVYPQ